MEAQRRRIQRAVEPPAVALVVLASAWSVLIAIDLVAHARGIDFTLFLDERWRRWSPAVNALAIAVDAAWLAVMAFLFLAALRMRRLKGHGAAVAACALACLPCLSPMCVAGIPFGLWGLAVLSRREVEEAFA